MPNKHRGEMVMKLDGREYVLRPSFGVIAEIEDATGKSIRSHMLSAGSDIEGQAKATFKDAVTVLWLATKGSKNRDVPSIEDFGELIRAKMGFALAVVLMGQFCGNACLTDDQLEEIHKIVEEKQGTKDADPSQPSEEETDPERK